MNEAKNEMLKVSETIEKEIPETEETEFEYKEDAEHTNVSWEQDPDLSLYGEESPEPLNTLMFLGTLGKKMIDKNFNNSTSVIKSNESSIVSMDIETSVNIGKAAFVEKIFAKFMDIKHYTDYVGKHNYVKLTINLDLQLIVDFEYKIENDLVDFSHNCEMDYEECLKLIDGIPAQ